jgi:hypothetical protein
MEAIPTDTFGYKRNDLSADTPNPVINAATLDSNGTGTVFNISPISDASSFISLENGDIIFQSMKRPATGSGEALEEHFVTVHGNYTSVPIGSGFRLYDDDDFGLNREPLPRNDLVDDTMKNVYKEAFIDVIDTADFKGQDFNPNKTVDFYRNHPVMIGSWGFQTPGVWDDAINLVDSKPLWVANLIAGYQGEVGDDRDPKNENYIEGITPGLRNYTIVYVEVVRDRLDDIFRNPLANGLTINIELDRNI